jgi:DNA-binding LacI/PurR family transcriptional regulator
MTARRPTISDVARHVGVSKGAVSFALNGRGGVSADTRDRILAAARELGWQPNQRARSLSVSRAFAFGLVLERPPELLRADPFFPAFIAGVETILAPAGYALVLQVVSDDRAEEAGYRRLAGEGRVDGVFLSDLRTNDPRIDLLAELKLAAVTLNRPDTPSPFAAVSQDDGPGIAQAIDHLVQLGHARIAHVSGPSPFVHAVSRRNAWAGALADAGLRKGPLVTSDFTAQGGATATAKLLDLADPPTAIVYANDLMAIAGIGVAQNRGLSVPTDLSVTGFDDTELSSHMHPSLTTITADPFGWGRAAATTLLDAVEGRRVADVDLEPAQLKVRQSTAAPPRRSAQKPRRRRSGSSAAKPVNRKGN